MCEGTVTSKSWRIQSTASPTVSNAGDLKGRSQGMTRTCALRPVSRLGRSRTSNNFAQWLRGSDKRGSDERYCIISASCGWDVFSDTFSATRAPVGRWIASQIWVC